MLGDLEVNHSVPRKFVQTFLLAEQPTGYYVLNDIFRYLKEPDFEDEDAPEKAAVPEQPKPTPLSKSPLKEVKPAPVKPEAVPVAAPIPVPVATKKPEWTEAHKAPVKTAPVAEKPPAPKVASPTKATAPAVVPVASESKSSRSAAKTWATLADTNKGAWGAKRPVANGVANGVAEVKPAAAAPPPAPVSKPAEEPVESAPVESNKERLAGGKKEGDEAVFIRGFTKATGIGHIKDEFARSVGPIRWVELLSGVSNQFFRPDCFIYLSSHFFYSSDSSTHPLSLTLFPISDGSHSRLRSLNLWMPPVYKRPWRWARLLLMANR